MLDQGETFWCRNMQLDFPKISKYLIPLSEMWLLSREVHLFCKCRCFLLLTVPFPKEIQLSQTRAFSARWCRVSQDTKKRKGRLVRTIYLLSVRQYIFLSRLDICFINIGGPIWIHFIHSVTGFTSLLFTITQIELLDVQTVTQSVTYSVTRSVSRSAPHSVTHSVTYSLKHTVTHTVTYYWN